MDLKYINVVLTALYSAKLLHGVLLRLLNESVRRQ